MKPGYQTTFVRNFSIEKTENQNALICFVNGKFDKCVFHTEKVPYTFDDWLFLREVSEKIKEMADMEKSLWEKVCGL